MFAQANFLMSAPNGTEQLSTEMKKKKKKKRWLTP